MQITNLSFTFNTHAPYFFNNLSVEFTPNTLNFIQGENGIGKSTLFKIIQGTVNTQSNLTGTITLENHLYHAHNNHFAREFTTRVHTVQQHYDHMIAPQFSFMHNLQLAGMPTRPKLTTLPQPHLLDIVRTLSINVDTPAYLLSGGQRQLLAILMALQKPTSILLLDEPTASLDTPNTHMIIERLRYLATHLKVTMLIICHDKQLVQKYADNQYYVMKKDASEKRIVTIAD